MDTTKSSIDTADVATVRSLKEQNLKQKCSQSTLKINSQFVKPMQVN